jgi:hypothetical protein
MLEGSTHVWCENCRASQPAIRHEMSGRDVTGQFEAPVDVVCDHCKYIVATFYRAPAPAPA